MIRKEGNACLLTDSKTATSDLLAAKRFQACCFAEQPPHFFFLVFVSKAVQEELKKLLRDSEVMKYAPLQDFLRILSPFFLSLLRLEEHTSELQSLMRISN